MAVVSPLPIETKVSILVCTDANPVKLGLAMAKAIVSIRNGAR
jgi:hypothetical protein